LCACGAPERFRAARSTRTLGISLPIVSELDRISTHLRAYGENEAATWVLSLNAEQHNRLGELASSILHGSNENMYLAKALALAAVQLYEGSPRPLKRKRRLMTFYDESAGSRADA
jgi:hypothetical protein